MSKLILVTGGAGFIGYHLIAKILDQGMRVRVLDNLSPQIHGHNAEEPAWLHKKNIQFIRGTVTSAHDWEKSLEGVNAVVHLAAETGTGQSMYEIARYNEVNSQGTALLFDVLGGMKNRMVERVLLASSRSVYGEGAYACEPCKKRVYPKSRLAEQMDRHQWDPNCPDCNSSLKLVATTEDDKVLPASVYAATKCAQEDLVRVCSESLGIGYINYRFQNVYGERQSLKNPYTGILSIFSTKIRKDSELPLFEDGLESRDFVHVDDVAAAVMQGLLIAKAPNAVINVGSGKATSVKEVASELTLAFGKEPKLKVTAQYRIGDIRHNYADIRQLKKLLSFEPQIGLREGLQRFAKWVETQPIPEDMLEKANNELRERKLMK